MEVSSIILLIVIGAIVGSVANFIMRGGAGLIGSIIFGLAGAALGTFLADKFDVYSKFGLDSGSMLVTAIVDVIGACIVILIFKIIFRKK